MLKVIIWAILWLDLREPSIKAGFNLSVTTPDIGEMLRDSGITDQLDMHLASASLTIALQGHTLREMASQSTLSATVTGGGLTLPDIYTGKQFAVKLEQGQFISGPELGTTLALTGQAGELPLSLKLTSESFSYTQQEVKQFPVALDVTLGETALSAESLIQLPLNRQQAKLALQAFTPNLNHFNRFTGIDLPPYGPITLAGAFSLDDIGYQLQDLLIKVNNSYLNGQGSFIPPKNPQDKPSINLVLTAPFIQLDDFGVKNWKAWLEEKEEEDSQQQTPSIATVSHKDSEKHCTTVKS